MSAVVRRLAHDHYRYGDVRVFPVFVSGEGPGFVGFGNKSHWYYLLAYQLGVDVEEVWAGDCAGYALLNLAGYVGDRLFVPVITSRGMFDYYHVDKPGFLGESARGRVVVCGELEEIRPAHWSPPRGRNFLQAISA